MPQRTTRDPLRYLRADPEPHGGLRFTFDFDVAKDDDHHAIFKPGDSREEVADRLRHLADLIDHAAAPGGGFPPVEVQDLKPGDVIRYTTLQAAGERVDLRVNPEGGYGRWQESVREVVRGRGGSVVGVIVGKNANDARVVSRERIVRAWRP